jgi:hypothetical protein
MHFFATKVLKNPFYSVGRKLMFGSVSEQFANLQHVKDAILMLEVSALFRGTKVAKHSFYSIGTKTMIGSVLEHFSNLQHVNKMQNMCFRAECTISGCQSCVASILLHWTQNDVWECFGAFCYPLARKKMQNFCSSLNAISLYQSCEAFILPHWIQNGVWECFEAFR